jgi:fumarylacetoacetate (FAA) hydrolase
MKLATYKDGSRDGQLVVVSRDLALAQFATGIATRLQAVLDDWNFLSPQLEDLYATLNGGKARHAFAFDPRLAMAPLPRAPLWLVHDDEADATGAAAGAEAAGDAVPLLRQRAGDSLCGAHDDAVFAPQAEAIDLGAGLAVVTGDLPLGCSPARALDGVRLLLLVNGWALRGAAPDGAAQPAPGVGPVAVTPDELGDLWQGGRAALRVKVDLDGRPLGRLDAASAQRLSFGDLLACAAAVRPLGAGSVVAGGALVATAATQGFASRAQQRRHERSGHGEPRSPWLSPGARVQIEAFGRDGHSVFGQLLQRVRQDGVAVAGSPGGHASASASASTSTAPAAAAAAAVEASAEPAGPTVPAPSVGPATAADPS